MIRCMGTGLLLSLFLLPMTFADEQPKWMTLSEFLDMDRSKRPSVLRDNLVSLKIYREGRAASALPAWWHHPASMISFTEVVHQDRLGQQGIIRVGTSLPEYKYLGPRGPIIDEEEEALLGF